jgi:hypothetical protein
MRAIEVELDFVCDACGHFVGVTLRCTGKGLAAGPHTVAAVKVACPACEVTNQLLFESCGRLRAVDAVPNLDEVLEPSIN